MYTFLFWCKHANFKTFFISHSFSDSGTISNSPLQGATWREVCKWCRSLPRRDSWLHDDLCWTMSLERESKEKSFIEISVCEFWVRVQDEWKICKMKFKELKSGRNVSKNKCLLLKEKKLPLKNKIKQFFKFWWENSKIKQLQIIWQFYVKSNFTFLHHIFLIFIIASHELIMYVVVILSESFLWMFNVLLRFTRVSNAEDSFLLCSNMTRLSRYWIFQ